MKKSRLSILTIELEDDGIFVTFSDGTSTGFVIEELLKIRPKRFRDPPPPKPPKHLKARPTPVRPPHRRTAS